MNEKRKNLVLHFLGDRVAFKRNQADGIEQLPVDHDSEREFNKIRAANTREEADALEEAMDIILKEPTT